MRREEEVFLPENLRGENDPANPAEYKGDLQQQSLLLMWVIPISVGIQKSWT